MRGVGCGGEIKMKMRDNGFIFFFHRRRERKGAVLACVPDRDGVPAICFGG